VLWDIVISFGVFFFDALVTRRVIIARRQRRDREAWSRPGTPRDVLAAGLEQLVVAGERDHCAYYRALVCIRSRPAPVYVVSSWHTSRTTCSSIITYRPYRRVWPRDIERSDLTPMDHHHHHHNHHHDRHYQPHQHHDAAHQHYHAQPYARDYFLYEYSSGSESDGTSSLNSDCDSGGHCGKSNGRSRGRLNGRNVLSSYLRDRQKKKNGKRVSWDIWVPMYVGVNNNWFPSHFVHILDPWMVLITNLFAFAYRYTYKYSQYV